ncbi:hypothetical protein N824_10545 [Pedobacter sp. V48]|nr:hypothetical protein N824_10545 [Pedobacter sp. V48]
MNESFKTKLFTFQGLITLLITMEHYTEFSPDLSGRNFYIPPESDHAKTVEGFWTVDQIRPVEIRIEKLEEFHKKGVGNNYKK